jgi:hypothetical protein
MAAYRTAGFAFFGHPTGNGRHRERTILSGSARSEYLNGTLTIFSGTCCQIIMVNHLKTSRNWIIHN